jgi:hypothetical protein
MENSATVDTVFQAATWKGELAGSCDTTQPYFYWWWQHTVGDSEQMDTKHRKYTRDIYRVQD